MGEAYRTARGSPVPAPRDPQAGHRSDHRDALGSAAARRTPAGAASRGPGAAEGARSRAREVRTPATGVAHRTTRLRGGRTAEGRGSAPAAIRSEEASAPRLAPADARTAGASDRAAAGVHAGRSQSSFEADPSAAAGQA